MNKGPFFNIFDQKDKDKGKTPAPKKIPEKAKAPIESKIILTNDDVQKMFERMLELRNEFDKKKEEFREAVLLSKQDVSNYFKDPKNFTPEQWIIIQESRTDLEKRVFAIVGRDLKKVKQKQIESKDSKTRKGKTLGARRNWIPLR